MSRLVGIDVRGINLDLVYDDGYEDIDRLMDEVFAPADAEPAAFDYLDFIKRVIESWDDILALLIKLGIIPAAVKAEMAASKFGDGQFLKYLIEYLPQIIDLLLKLGVLKPKEAAEFAAGVREFGDGTLLKLIGQFLLKILPLLLMLLKDEPVSDIGDQP